MYTEQIRDSLVSKEGRVCPWQHVHLFDNFLRPLFHSPQKLFGSYVRSGMRVLDLGCGKGFASLGLARLVGEDGLVISVDLQPEMLEMVKERAARAGLSGRIRIQRCEVDRIGVRHELDFVLAFWIVHEVPNTRPLLKEIFTLLKPGGRFFIAEPKVHVSHPDFVRTLQEAREVGFTVSERPRVSFSRAVVLAKEL